MSAPLTSQELSSIAGWTSIACWIVVSIAPVWENYQLKSGEGLSVTFIVLWLLGDLTNLAGGAMARVLPTMIILATYYTICDIVLLFQVYYYRYLARRRAAAASSITAHESSPLLDPTSTSDSVTHSTTTVPLTPTPHQPKPLLPPVLEYPLLLLFVISAGVLAWYFTKSSDEISIPEKPGKGEEVALEWKSQVLGWASAVLYLGSRVPQIAHNYKTRCAGLSLAMFFFSISGNVTYVLSILLTSLEPRYLITNASWLAGSGLTVFLDLFVLAQFAVFSMQDKKAAREGKVFVDDDREEVTDGEAV